MLSAHPDAEQNITTTKTINNLRIRIPLLTPRRSIAFGNHGSKVGGVQRRGRIRTCTCILLARPESCQDECFGNALQGFATVFSNAPTADQSLTGGFPHNERGKVPVIGTRCALKAGLSDSACAGKRALNCGPGPRMQSVTRLLGSNAEHSTVVM